MTNGSVVGKHEGVAFYTVGQRRGLGVSAGGRLYVVRIEAQKDRVVLGQRRDLETASLEVSDACILPFDRLEAPLSVGVKVRYRSTLQPATIRPAGGNRISVDFKRPVIGVTPGQAAVFYDDDVVVGGGTIEG
jgi:tRNA-specific 2-thiouridylase